MPASDDIFFAFLMDARWPASLLAAARFSDASVDARWLCALLPGRWFASGPS